MVIVDDWVFTSSDSSRNAVTRLGLLGFNVVLPTSLFSLLSIKLAFVDKSKIIVDDDDAVELVDCPSFGDKVVGGTVEMIKFKKVPVVTSEGSVKVKLEGVVTSSD
uniref:Uncharacterized protein n=1 Tax=Tetranychus urticae TaxID=32264 RepID=T1JZ28_TETUR